MQIQRCRFATSRACSIGCAGLAEGRGCTAMAGKTSEAAEQGRRAERERSRAPRGAAGHGSTKRSIFQTVLAFRSPSAAASCQTSLVPPAAAARGVPATRTCSMGWAAESGEAGRGGVPYSRRPPRLLDAAEAVAGGLLVVRALPSCSLPLAGSLSSARAPPQ